MATLHKWSRYPLIRFKPERVPSLCDGIGSFLLAMLRVGINITTYRTAKVSDFSAGISVANCPSLESEFKQQLEP